MRHTLIREQFLSQTPEEVFAFYADARNLERITPPWLHFRILNDGPIAMQPGTLIDYRIRVRGLPVNWRTRITVWDPPHRFVDVQIRGPYRTWEHTHEFHAVAGGTLVRDLVSYELPAGWLGEMVRRLFVARDVAAIFDHRRTALASIFEEPARS